MSWSYLRRRIRVRFKKLCFRYGEYFPPVRLIYEDQYVLIPTIQGDKGPRQVHLEYIEEVGQSSTNAYVVLQQAR